MGVDFFPVLSKGEILRLGYQIGDFDRGEVANNETQIILAKFSIVCDRFAIGFGNLCLAR